MKVQVLTPCFPRFEGDFHVVFIKNQCDILSKKVQLSVLAPRTRTLHKLNTSYPVMRFPYMPRQSFEHLPEATMKGAPLSKLIELPPYLWSAFHHINVSSSDIIHAHLAIPLGVVASLSKLPSIITCHGSDLTLPLDKPKYLPFTSLALRKASIVTPVSQYLEKIAWRLGADREKTRTIYLGVDTSRFSPQSKKGKITIGTLGRLVSEKNVEDLIYATRILQDQYDLHLRIGGDGPEKKRLEVLALKLGLNSFEMCGTVFNPVAFHRSLDVFVLCSTREGLSISLQEAMSCGVVPVAVNACGCDELVSHRENGFLFHPRDIDDLVAKLKYAIDSELGGKARQTILENFDSIDNAEKYLHLYQQLGHHY